MSAGAPATSATRLPEGVAIQPRRFEWRALASVPRYWFADNPLITHFENAFSLMIPAGERFFIRSVRNYEHVVTDPEMKELVRAFTQQEGQHIRAHDEFNRSLAQHGIDVDLEVAEAERAMARMQRWLPKKMQLGVTVFLEHVTAMEARLLFTEPVLAESMDDEMARFWSWHAAEELEHKAVAFDVFRAAGGGFFLRVLSAIAALVFLARPFRNSVRRMMRADPNGLRREHVHAARQLQRQFGPKQLRYLRAYFKPRFHPWKHDDRPELEAWYATQLSAGSAAEAGPHTGGATASA